MRLAHFSDVHALSLRGASPFWFFNKRFAGGVNLLLRRRGKHPYEIFEALVRDLNQVAPDHVAVTGDLSNLSLPAELRLARAALDRITLGEKGVSVVPGNHDIYVNEAKEARYFERCLSPYALSDDADGAAFATFPFVRVRGEIALIGACTARPSPPPLADGRLGPAQLRGIEELLAKTKGHFRVLLMHHPPVENRWEILRGLRDRHQLLEVVKRVGCELILHGHEHRDVRAQLASVPVIGVGSGTYADEREERRARYNIYEIHGGRLRSIEKRIYDPGACAFVSAGTTLE